MELSAIANVDVVVLLLGFLVNYLLETDIRKSFTNMVFFAFAIILVFSSFKMLYTEEMAMFNVQGGYVKILMETYFLKF
jgi:hypothetical protein